MTSSSIDKAIANLLKWVGRPEWKQCSADVYLEHLNLIAGQLDTSVEELLELIGTGPVWHALEIFITEDFFTTWFEKEDGELVNIIQDYLKRRGWKESVPARVYLEALRDSIPSLYEVIEINPGISMKLKDLIGDDGTIVVLEKSATKDLVKWDCLAARVITMNRRHYLTGGPLRFSQKMSRNFLDCYENYLDLYKQQTDSQETIEQNMPLLLSSFWAAAVFIRTMAPMPIFQNTDDEPILLSEAHFPVLGDMMEVAAILEKIPELVRVPENEEAEEPGREMAWSWVAPGDPSHRSLQRGKRDTLPEEITEDTDEEIGLTGLGYVVLKAETMILDTNSRERCERGQDLLESHLGELVGRAVTTYKDIYKLMEDADRSPPANEIKEAIPNEVVEQTMHDYYDKHYRRVLDAPLEALGHLTPREAAKRSLESRYDVIDWLKELENREQRLAWEEGIASYDTSWMWQELGIQEPG
ncbi:MAG: hypothetical protein F4X92_08875 [Gammaproteobacteria bacterium]|nr:hypothetical protein [Gammaproteobacteria bacterium]